MNPQISVLVPYYNDSAFLKDCIDSILSQSFSDFELILLNHASTDDSEEIAKSYKDQRIKHIKLTENYGAGSGLLMIEALKIAKGKYYKPFCADDLMVSQCLMYLYIFLENNQDIDVTFGNMAFVNHKLNSTGELWWNNHAGLGLDNIEIIKHFLAGRSILPYPAVMCKLDILNAIKIEKVLHTQFDMTIWVQLLIKGYKFKCFENVVCRYRIHDNQASSSTRSFKIINSSMFESICYIKYFMDIKSVQLARAVLPNNVFVQILKDEDVHLIPFVVAYSFLHHGCLSYVCQGFLSLKDIMSNDELREEINQKFSYGIKDFRAQYASVRLFYDIDSLKTSKLIKYVKKRIKGIIKQKIKSFFYKHHPESAGVI